MPTRRDVLRAAGATALGTGVVASTASAATTDHYDAQPEHVTLEHDTATLDRYRPMLVLRDVDRAKLLGLYGMVARSPERETSVCVYATSWSHQEGVSQWGPLNDSHYGDHEWFYVAVDEATGGVEEVVFSAYHWIAGRAYAGTVSLYDDTHPKAHVVSPWHQYYLTETEGALLEVDDLTAAYPTWLDNGLAESVEPGTVTNPWTMTGTDARGHWWRDGVGGVSTDALLASTFYRLGWFGAEEADPDL